MSSAETGPQAAQPAPPPAAPRAAHRLSFWLKELPFALVLILTTLGVAYTSFSKQPMAERRRPDGAADIDRLASAALACLHRGDEHAVAAERAAEFHRQLDRDRGLHFARARHLHRRPAGLFLAGLRARSRHGARRSGHRLDRKFGAGRRRDLRLDARRRRRGVVALA
jgi:hypothetical protein